MINLFDLESYNYNLPEERIAQTPAEPRDASRLLIWHVQADKIEHKYFRDILDYIKAEEDLLVLNNTRVIPARLNGNRMPGGGQAEILLLNPVNNSGEWRVLAKPGRKLKAGAEVKIADRVIKILAEEPDGIRLAKIGENNQDIFNFLEKFGSTPLPPYIHSENSNKWCERYQTVFANINGSAAAPTASLHFTPELLEKFNNKAWVTLHVGLGTFRPVKSQDIREHVIHKEYCEIPELTANEINKIKSCKGRVIASGTTVARTLEALKGKAGALNTDLFIYPGFNFKVIDALITNFHLPKSSLMMLVASFAANLLGNSEQAQEQALLKLLNIYETAADMGYRFFSFGDAMLII
ncbi:MAG: tRNA preQ1(34) S-adenosylmethionine ribosyltransferase-isomerase QueA [Synergistaceae bacterium]|nr:tRNA preQ1(34) S-adenosylmethionine ribosyltransferase-isomerase QueA [Synergistaceae bacterium]